MCIRDSVDAGLQGAAGRLLAARGREAEQQRQRDPLAALIGGVGGQMGVVLQLGGQPGQVLAAGVIFQQEGDVYKRQPTYLSS